MCVRTDLNGLEKMQGGEESSVYAERDKRHVVKFLDITTHYDGWLEFFDGLALFNYLFPGTAYEVIGFSERTADGEERMTVMLRQMLVQGIPLAKAYENDLSEGRSKVEGFMGKIGFEDSDEEGTFFSNKWYVVGDLHLNNVFLGDDGRLYVIDAAVSPNTVEDGIGGIREIPEMSVAPMGGGVSFAMGGRPSLSERIRRATGWERGGDGTWRYGGLESVEGADMRPSRASDAESAKRRVRSRWGMTPGERRANLSAATEGVDAAQRTALMDDVELGALAESGGRYGQAPVRMAGAVVSGMDEVRRRSGMTGFVPVFDVRRVRRLLKGVDFTAARRMLEMEC